MMRPETPARAAHYRTRYKHELSPREREVLSLVTKGRTNGEIAADLGLSFDTVKSHVSAILGKLEVASREDAAECWRHHNSFGGRLGRAWSGVSGLLALKTTAAGIGVAGAVAVGVAVVAVTWATLSENGGALAGRASAPLRACLCPLRSFRRSPVAHRGPQAQRLIL